MARKIKHVERISVRGFKSFRELDLELRGINIFVGANGAGKSNLIDLFRLLRDVVEQRLQSAVELAGGADALLHLGPKETTQIGVKIMFDVNSYEFTLVPTTDGRLIFASERAVYHNPDGPEVPLKLGAGHREAKLKDRENSEYKARYCYGAISRWVVYHFHDTSPTAWVRRKAAINDNEFLRHDAANLAAFLLPLQTSALSRKRRNKTVDQSAYERIRGVVRLAAPFFDDFKLRPTATNPELTQLEWTQIGSDRAFRPSQLSDGTLRFICLAAALLQPHPPDTLIFDEPELGLHPYALTLLASMIKRAARIGRQVIVCTQSPTLLNEFEPDDVIVIDRRDGQSVFRRQSAGELSEWLEDYNLGEIWQKNIMGGRPHGERGGGPRMTGGKDRIHPEEGGRP